MKCIFLLLPFFLTAILFSQEPVLVADYSPGAGDAFTINERDDIESAYLGDDIVFSIDDGVTGAEPSILSDGNITRLIDVNPGPAGSSPASFTLYNGKVFFTATGAEGRRSLWSTDGTPEGTNVVFNSCSDITTDFYYLIVSGGGYLYFTCNGNLFRYDGETEQRIFEGVALSDDFLNKGKNYTTYQEEIAFLTPSEGAVMLYVTQEDTVALLGEVVGNQFNDIRGYGISEWENGLVFEVDESFSGEADGLYTYNAMEGTIERLVISDGTQEARILNFLPGKSLGWISGEGYYGISGISGDEELLYSSNLITYEDGQTIAATTHQEKGVFFARQAFIGTNESVYTDGTVAGTTTLYATSPFSSNFVTAGKYAFHASGIASGFRPKLYYIDLETGAFSNFYNYTEGSSIDRSIVMLGVQNNRLYYFSNLDATVGRELYYIDLGIDVMTNVIDYASFVHDVRITPDSYEVSSEKFSEMAVEVFATDGRLVERLTGLTNTIYDTSHLRGVFIVRFTVDGAVAVRKVLW